MNIFCNKSRIFNSLFCFHQPHHVHRPHKKLRITVKRSTSNAGPSILILSNLLEKTSNNSNESLQILTQISDSLSSNTVEDIHESIRKLCDHFKRERESAVRVKVLFIFTQ